MTQHCTQCLLPKLPEEYATRSDTNHRTRRTICRPCAAQNRKAYDKAAPVATAIRHMFGGAKKRAKDKGLAFELEAYREQLAERLQRGHCELTGIPFALGTSDIWNSATLDRICPTKGYVYSNVRLILFAANLMLGSWGEEVASQVATAFLAKRTSHDTQRTLERL